MQNPERFRVSSFRPVHMNQPQERCDQANINTRGDYRCTRKNGHAGPCAAVRVKGLFQGCQRDGVRVLLWPIRLLWSDKLASTWFTVHGWECAPDRVQHRLTSFGMMPGYRKTMGWTFHLGRLKVCFGPGNKDKRR